MTITENIAAIKEKMNTEEVTIIAVSKTHPPSAIEEAYHAGLTHFGENYIQEALLKMQSLSYLPIHWHFIGPLQSNKLKMIAERFDWVDTVTKASEAEKLHRARPANKPPLNICLQINIDNASTKSGVTPDAAVLLAEQCLHYPNLHLRGLMAIPKPETDYQLQLKPFIALANVKQQLNQRLNLNLTTLSMGMSNDYLAAIAAGSTMIRLGTAIFGTRTNINYTKTYPC